MPESETPKKKQSWRFASLSSLRSPPRSFLCHPEPRAIGSFVRGEQLLAYQFIFAGQRVEAPDTSIWNLQPPGEAFLRATQNFSWLDDLAAVGDGPARKRAQEWLLEWIEAFGQNNGTGWHPGLAGQRVIHWCSHAMFLFKGLKPKASAAVFRSLGRHVNFLSNNWKNTPQGVAKFEALTGLAYAGLSLEGCEYVLRPALKGLAAECASWIDTDGAIPTRNPEELSEVFTLLTWVAKLLEQTGHPADSALTRALGRMAPGLRSLRYGDGGLARFHGGGRGNEGQLDQALADAQVRSGASQNSFMGFERLSAGRVVVIMDGTAPPISDTSHASQLGFGMSSGRLKILEGCGPGQRLGKIWANACAQTAAHNAVTVEGQGARSADVSLDRAQDFESVWLSATSRGFEAAFGLMHERRLLIANNGTQFSGEDRLFPLNAPTENTHPTAALARPSRGHSYMAHFHLHPDVEAEQKDQIITLTLPNAEVWIFRQEGGLMCLMDSVTIDRSFTEPRATKQIVVAGRSIDYVGGIRWSFTKA